MGQNISHRIEAIIDDINNYIQKVGGSYSDWYVGIGEDAQDIVLNIHKVNSNFWMYKETESPQIAREVVNYFVNTLGTDGDVGAGDYAGHVVYACKKAKRTNP